MKFNLTQYKNKSGIYRWTNKLTLDTYIGSAVNLYRRLGEYTSPNFLLKETYKNNSIIYKALLKYGYDNFNLEILEYCDKNSLIEREQFYINTFKPTYNICKIAGSSLGRKTEKYTKYKLTFALLIRWYKQKNINISFSEFVLKFFENKIKRSDIKIKQFYKNYTLIKKYNQFKIPYDIRRKILASTKTATPIVITDLKSNITTYYPSIRNAAFVLCISPYNIRRILNNKKSRTLDNRYTFKKL